MIYSKRKKRKLICSILFIILVIILWITAIIYIEADRRFREQNKALYQDEMEFYKNCMEEEKEWLFMQQGKEGAIYLYELEETVPGSVVPYFSCFAALGMLAGEPGEEELQYVESYLIWHTEELVKSEGIISDYRVTSEGMEAKGSYDSVDSYVALYLNLLATYVQKGGSLKNIPRAEEAVELCVARLEELTKDGLTKISEEKEIYYLMDNLEVLEAYTKMEKLMKSKNEEIASWKNKKSLSKFFQDGAKECKEQIKKNLWNKKEKRFEIGINSDYGYFNFEGIQNFYPYAIAQVYPVACGIEIIEKEKTKKLYSAISKEHSWENLELTEDFEWPVLSYVAVKLEDVESAENYLEQYRDRYKEDRSYPFNTSNSGWVIRAYAALYDYYEAKANQSLLDYWMEQIKS